MDGRVVAEEQQQRLKKAVSSRAKVLQEINEMMLRRICGTDASNSLREVEKTDAMELEPDDIALFEEYLQDMDEVYKQTDETFRAAGVDENPLESYKVGPQWKRDGDLEYFENLDVTLFPFSFERTSSAMWQAIQHVHRHESRQHYNGVTDPESTIAVKCRIPSPKDNGELVDMLIHVVIKKYVQPDRMVIVWRALTEGDNEFSGMHSDETGWSVIRPHKTEGAIIQAFTRYFPLAIATTFGDKVRTDQFSNFRLVCQKESSAPVIFHFHFFVLEMTTLLSDEAFLAQVDQFLTSCDTPLQPVKDTASIKKETMQSPQISIKSKPKRTNALVIKREFERAKDRKRRQVYRDRRRLERDSLRLEVSKLSETLCRVQQVKEQKPSLASIAWKAVAKNQFEALKAARAQQEALKSAVETRFQLIQEFGGFITELCKDVENVPSNGHKPVEIGPTDTLIFETFL
eukprot:jgi/Phyca11/45605/gw1.59.44.1